MRRRRPFAALFAQIGERQRECRGHAEPLHDAQRHKDRQVWSDCQQRGRNRERDKADKNARRRLMWRLNSDTTNPETAIPSCSQLTAKPIAAGDTP